MPLHEGSEIQVGMSLSAFTAELEGWKLAPPKFIEIAVPGNQNCGQDEKELG